MAQKVIDVSTYQGMIDWSKAKAAGIEGTMIRSGFGVKDPNQVDKQFQSNISGCQSNGISFGIYHYGYAKSPAEAEQEATFCLEIIQGIVVFFAVYE